MVTAAERHYALGVRAFALVDLGDSEAIDLFLREEDAQAALKGCSPGRARLGRRAVRLSRSS